MKLESVAVVTTPKRLIFFVSQGLLTMKEVEVDKVIVIALLGHQEEGSVAQ